MSSKLKRFGISVVAIAGLALMGCGDDEDGFDSCPSEGIVCHNCAGSGDCDVTCGGGEVEYCGHWGWFDDPDLRCAFCGPPDLEL